MNTWQIDPLLPCSACAECCCVIHNFHCLFRVFFFICRKFGRRNFCRRYFRRRSFRRQDFLSWGYFGVRHFHRIEFSSYGNFAVRNFRRDASFEGFQGLFKLHKTTIVISDTILSIYSSVRKLNML